MLINNILKNKNVITIPRTMFLLIFILLWSYVQAMFTGDMTAYGPTLTTPNGASGYNCGFMEVNSYIQKYYVAMNAQQYAGATSCGKCVRVYYNCKFIDVYVVDQCGDCGYGGLDMSIDAYTELTNEPLGRVIVDWEYISCNDIVQDSIKLYFQPGSSRWWIGIQVLNSKEPIYDIDISYKDTIHHLMLSSYNFWHLIHTFVLEVPFDIILISETQKIITYTVNTLISDELIDINQQF